MDRNNAIIKIKPDKVYVIFDTNSIHPGSDENKLLSSRLADYVNLRSTVPYKLLICIPDIAVKERQYQIKQKAISSWEKAERSLRFLCQALPLTREEAIQTAFNFLEKEIKSTGVDILPLEFSNVNFESISKASIERKPPFSSSGEKGFRDALIAETIVQFVGTLPTDPHKCLVIVVSGDKILIKALEKRDLSINIEYVLDHNNAINRLVALGEGVSYSKIQKILFQADEKFISRDWKSGLFCEEKLESKILEQFEKEILDPITFVPAYFEKEDFFVSTPSLIKVDGNLWHFITFVEFQGGLWVAGHCDNIDYLEESILKRSVTRKVLDPNDGFLSALLTKLTITFRIDWHMKRFKDDRLSNASLSAIAPYMKKSLGPEHVFSGRPELLGFRSPKNSIHEPIHIREIDRNRHRYIEKPEWIDTHCEHDIEKIPSEETPSNKSTDSSA